MTQRHSRHKSHPASTSKQTLAHHASRTRRDSRNSPKASIRHEWDELCTPQQTNPTSNLTRLIEHDAPLKTHSGLVLMYGPFQAEMQPEGQGVATWIKDCVRKHGIPSLVRYDYRHRAQIFRRDQFQSWLEPLLSRISS